MKLTKRLTTACIYIFFSTFLSAQNIDTCKFIDGKYYHSDSSVCQGYFTDKYLLFENNEEKQYPYDSIFVEAKFRNGKLEWFSEYSKTGSVAYREVHYFGNYKIVLQRPNKQSKLNYLHINTPETETEIELYKDEINIIENRKIPFNEDIISYKTYYENSGNLKRIGYFTNDSLAFIAKSFCKNGEYRSIREHTFTNDKKEQIKKIEGFDNGNKVVLIRRRKDGTYEEKLFKKDTTQITIYKYIDISGILDNRISAFVYNKNGDIIKTLNQDSTARSEHYSKYCYCKEDSTKLAFLSQSNKGKEEDLNINYNEERLHQDISNTIKIGSQIWMEENLRINRFRNGDTIPYITDNEAWFDAFKKGKPAWCYYKNNPENVVLYNWYAITDMRGLAPKGWRIPSKSDWEMLIDFLGGIENNEKEFINELKDISFYKGFQGFRAMDGRFLSRSKNSQDYSEAWWSDTELSTWIAWHIQVSMLHGYNVIYGDIKKGFGLSVKCIKER